MAQVEPRTLKGFRDFLPSEARKRQYVIQNFIKVFESFGFEPLETPALEYEDILLGKYGDDADKLVYKFKDHGERSVAMRYDQTVPLARVVAQYQNELTTPFKRYQIQNVWRAENTQKGRYREFVQCDIDIAGSSSPLADAEILAVVAKSYENLSFTNIKLLVNDRSIFGDLSPRAITIIDKLKKIGPETVKEELKEIDVDPSVLDRLLEAQPTERLSQIMKYAEAFGVAKSAIEFSPTLARGLDYYTGIIIEVECPEYPAGSLGGGGRYDNLVGMFANREIPAVGFAFGFDRTIEAMQELNLFHDVAKVSHTRVMVSIFNEELLPKSVELANYIRANGLNCELYTDATDRLDKQIKYADKKGIMYVAILGPEELKNESVTIKNLRVNDQQTVKRTDLLKVI